MKDNSWKLGDTVNSPVDEMLSLDPSSMDVTSVYKCMTGSIVPRPIAFVTTMNENGSINAAPFSYFNAVASAPPTIIISITFKSNGEKKDSLRNIERTDEFVVNTVGEWMLGPVNHCAAEYPYGVSEVEKVGLTTVASEIVSPPRIVESPVHFECKRQQQVQVGDGSQGSAVVVFGEIVRFHVFKKAFSQGRLDVQQLKPVGRLAGGQYSGLGPLCILNRPVI
jgi:flavin reductase (DIM6/NTAB) family NADH-FMN oxidoreductase RutF